MPDFDEHATTVARRARSLAHPTRVGLLRELAVLGDATPRELAERLGQPLGALSYHVRALRASRMIEVTRTIQRRGALEHHYRLSAAADPVLRSMCDLARDR